MPKGVKGIEDYGNRLLIRKLLIRQSRLMSGTFVDEEPLTIEEDQLITDARRDKSVDPKTKKTRWEQITGKKGCPGHVQASLNWNKMLIDTGDKTRSRINTGMKIKVYYLLKNSYGFTSIAIPTDEVDVPDWFKELPLDMKKMGTVLIDSKLKSTYSSLGWKIPKEATDDTNFDGFLEF
jgi:hypothetical protein